MVHVIPASKAHDVKPKMEAMFKKKGKTTKFSSLFDKVSGRAKVSPEILPLKYGREMEPHAIASFKTIFETYHRNAKVQRCGIFLCKDLPFVGGSPDGIGTCDCCGKFCLEVKSPFTVRDMSRGKTGMHLERKQQIYGVEEKP